MIFSRLVLKLSSSPGVLFFTLKNHECIFNSFVGSPILHSFKISANAFYSWDLTLMNCSTDFCRLNFKLFSMFIWINLYVLIIYSFLIMIIMANQDKKRRPPQMLSNYGKRLQKSIVFYYIISIEKIIFKY